VRLFSVVVSEFVRDAVDVRDAATRPDSDEITRPEFSGTWELVTRDAPPAQTAGSAYNATKNPVINPFILTFNYITIGGMKKDKKV
jgi:hypothetical protein